MRFVLQTIGDTAVARTARARVLAYFFLAGSGLGFLLLAFLPAASSRGGK